MFTAVFGNKTRQKISLRDVCSRSHLALKAFWADKWRRIDCATTVGVSTSQGGRSRAAVRKKPQALPCRHLNMQHYKRLGAERAFLSLFCQPSPWASKIEDARTQMNRC